MRTSHCLGIGAGVVLATAIGFVTGSPSEPSPDRPTPGRNNAVEQDLTGESAPQHDFRTTLELGSGSSRRSVVLLLSVENDTRSAFTVAHAVQVLDGQRNDLVPPAPAGAHSVLGNSSAKAPAATLDLSRLEDGYYEILVRTLGKSSSPADAASASRSASAHVYVALQGETVRAIDFGEWYYHSSASQLVIDGPNALGPVSNVEQFSTRLTKGAP